VLPLAELQRLVDRAEERIKDLRAREEALLNELTNVHEELEAIVDGAAPRVARAAKAAKPAKAVGKKRRGRRGHGPGGTTIAQAIEKVMREAGKPVGVPEITAALKKAKYPSKSKNLAKVVAMNITKYKQFRRVDRGLYQVA
jgi:hypothetical protein